MADSWEDRGTIRVGPLRGSKGYRKTLTEGHGVSNGVAYEFNLFQKAWFGSYECRVHRSLLDTPSKRIDTDEFEVYGHRWSVSIVYKEEGYLAAYLHSKNASTVKLMYSVAVLNQSGERQHRFGGDFCSFQPNGCWGWSKLVPITEMKDPELGFLLGDSFIVRMDLRFVHPENDKHTLSANAGSPKYTWNLRDLMGMSPLLMTSPEFTIAGHKWRLVIYPYGQEHGASHVGLNLQCLSDLPLPVQAKYKITVFNHHSDQKTISNEGTSIFCKSSTVWGWSEFMEIKSLEEEQFGFIKNGWITFTLYVEVMEDEQTRHPPQQAPPPRQTSSTEDPDCIFCLSKKQTSGVLHGKTSHKCVCGDCIKILEQHKLPCPICGKKVDQFIYEFF